MEKLTKKDFDFYKGWIRDSEAEHTAKMQSLNNPQEIINSYAGIIADLEAQGGISVKDTQDENYLFISTNTILPSLFYQVPRPIVKALPGGSEYSAAVLEALCQVYFTDKEKEENQAAIIDAFLPYGYGVVKVGYNSRVGKLNSGEVGEKTNMEHNVEYLKFERPVLTRVSPKDCFLDHTKPFGKGQAVTFKYSRNLQEVLDSNLYNITPEMKNYFGARSNSDYREVKLTIYEHWCMINGYAHKLVYTDSWQDELYWGKSAYKWLPYSLLRFNKPSDTLYPPSHGRLATNAQKKLNYLNKVWNEHVDKIQRKHLVYEDALTEQGIQALKRNEIDAIVTTKTPVTSGVYAQISSNPMGKDVYANIDNMRNYLKTLLSTSGGKAGESDAEFATTEKHQAAGDFMRSSGMQDSVRMFVRDQLKKMVSCLVNFGDPEVTVSITKKDVVDPNTGELITGKHLVFGGERGFRLNEEIEGDVELDYTYDIDITSAARHDAAVVRKQLADGIALGVQLRPVLQESGKDLDVAELLSDYFNTFDALPNPAKYVKDMTEEEQQALIQKQVMAQMQEQGGGGVPEAGAMEQGAETVQTGTEGLLGA